MNNDHATARQLGTEKLYEQKVQQLERRIQRRRKEHHVASENFMLWEEPVTLPNSLLRKKATGKQRR